MLLFLVPSEKTVLEVKCPALLKSASWTNASRAFTFSRPHPAQPNCWSPSLIWSNQTPPEQYINFFFVQAVNLWRSVATKLTSQALDDQLVGKAACRTAAQCQRRSSCDNPRELRFFFFQHYRSFGKGYLPYCTFPLHKLNKAFLTNEAKELQCINKLYTQVQSQ